MDGFLLVDKPLDWTSFDVVAKVRGMVRAETGLKKPKVGHAGTLDPRATGLLLLLVGAYCKQAQDFSGLDKTYDATVFLGTESTTADSEGEKTVISERVPTSEEVHKAVQKHIGAIEQVPPQFSAKKVDGKRAYDIARSGKTVTLKAQKVTIHDINIQDYTYPELYITTRVSSGTYIRSLATSIGDELGVGAYLSALHRTHIGAYSVRDAVTIDTLASTGVAPHVRSVGT